MALTYISLEDIEEVKATLEYESTLKIRFSGNYDVRYVLVLYGYSDKQKDLLKNLARALEPERLAPPPEPST